MEFTPAAVVVVPLAVIATQRRKWSLAFLTATAPFFSLTVLTALSHEFPPSEIALIALVAHRTVMWVRERRIEIRQPHVFGWLVAFGAVCALSVIYAAIRPADVPVHAYDTGWFGLFKFESFTFTRYNVSQLVLRLVFVGGVFAIADAIDGFEEVKRHLRWLVLTGVLVGLVGIAYQIAVVLGLPVATPLSWLGFDRFTDTPGYVGPLPRMYSLPGEPGFTADYLLYTFAASAILYISAHGDGVFTRRENVLVTFILGTTLLLSTGTTGYGGLIVLAVVLVGGFALFERLRTPTVAYTITAGVGALPLGITVDSTILGGKIRSLVFYQFGKITFSTGSGSIRLRYIFRTLEVIQARPLLGVGVGSHHIPSLLFTLLAEVGIIGLSTFLALHLSIFRRCGWLVNYDSRRGAVAAALVVAGVTLIGSNLVAKSISSLLFPWYWYSLALPFALVATMEDTSESVNTASQ